MALEQSKSRGSLSEWLTVVGFFGVLGLAGICSLGVRNGTRSVGSVIAGQLSAHGLPELPPKFRAYFDENFAFRPELVRGYGRLNVSLLRTSSSQQVVLGKDGWLFFSGDNALRDYRNVKPFTEAELNTWAGTLENRRKWLAARGCRYLFTVVPNSQTLYPEFMPPALNRVGEQSRWDQLLAHLQQHTQVTAVDLRPALREAKASSAYELYHRTDTHWNLLGGFHGYRQLARVLETDFPALRPLELDDFTIIRKPGPGGDLSRMLGLQADLPEAAVTLDWKTPRRARIVGDTQEAQTRDIRFEHLLTTECPGAPIPRAVMFRDSQAGALIPFLSEAFGRATYVWTDGWEFDCELIERERPQVVIEEIVERKLMRTAPTPQPGERN